MTRRLWIRHRRALELWRLCAAAPDRLHIAEDIWRLPAVASWPSTVLEDAVDDLVDAGVFTEAADGALCVRRWAA